jgi:NTP pyrophosphatase (non-canonical NTP hydrolase)
MGACSRQRAKARRAAIALALYRLGVRGRVIVRVVSDLIELRDLMRQFTEDRDWSRFHDPKSLLLALVGEVGELSELFQWLPADDAATLARQEPLNDRVEQELADVLLYLVRLADVLGVDLADASRRKLVDSSSRFDPDAVRGIAPRKS